MAVPAQAEETIKIMIVDDDYSIRKWMELKINQCNLPCQIIGLVSNGKDALEMCKVSMPDIVFADIKMPLMNGIEMLDILKVRHPQVMVIMLTSYNDFEYAREALIKKADDYILKNEITPDKISEIINRRASAGGLPAADDVKESGVTNADSLPIKTENNIENRIKMMIRTIEAKHNSLRNNRTSKHISNAIDYISNNFSIISGANDIAEYIHINTDYFGKLFKNQTGMHCNSFLNEIRLVYSAYQLIQTNLMIYEIAENVGFSNVSYFTTQFKKKFGICPYECRKECSSLL